MIETSDGMFRQVLKPAYGVGYSLCLLTTPAGAVEAGDIEPVINDLGCGDELLPFGRINPDRAMQVWHSPSLPFCQPVAPNHAHAAKAIEEGFTHIAPTVSGGWTVSNGESQRETLPG